MTAGGSAPSSSRGPAYIPGLNGLRALACLAVFGVHWQQFTGFAASLGPFDFKRFLENGNTGVSLFFTLSAFLLSLHFWSGSWGQPGRPWIGAYVRTRAVRILPPYYLCLVALVVLGRHWESAQERFDTLVHLGFVHNLVESTFYSLNPPFWTIAVQAQAYLLLPIILVLTLRMFSSWNARAWWLTMLVAVSYLAHWASLSLVPGPSGVAAWAVTRPTVAADSVIAHMPHFLLGLLAGLMFVRRASRTGLVDSATVVREAAVWLAALVILLILSTRLDDWFSLPHGRYNFPVVPVLIAWIVLEVPRTRAARWILEDTPLRFLGGLSYGVYVYHYPVLRLVGRVLRTFALSIDVHYALFGVVSLIVTIAIAELSLVFIEKPIVSLGTRWARRWSRSQPTRAAAR